MALWGRWTTSKKNGPTLLTTRRKNVELFATVYTLNTAHLKGSCLSCQRCSKALWGMGITFVVINWFVELNKTCSATSVKTGQPHGLFLLACYLFDMQSVASPDHQKGLPGNQKLWSPVIFNLYFATIQGSFLNAENCGCTVRNMNNYNLLRSTDAPEAFGTNAY